MKTLTGISLILIGIVAIGGVTNITTAFLLFGATLGLTWLRSFVRARRRRAVIDAFADREIARASGMSKH